MIPTLAPVRERRQSVLGFQFIPMHFPSLTIFGALAAGLWCAAGLQAGVLLDQKFSDTSRSEQALPASAAWFSTSSQSGVTQAGDNGLTLKVGGGNRFVLCYFTDAEAAAIPAGGSLKLEFVLSVAAPADLSSGFRFGLFDSRDTRISKDGVSNEDASFRNYAGYAVFANFVASGGKAANFRRRLPDSDDSLILRGLTCYQPLGVKGGGSSAFAADTEYVVEVTLRGDASALELSYRVLQDGQPLVEITSSDTEAVTAFDCLAIGAMAKSCESFTIKSVKVEVGE